ncbi:MAG: gliding motility-associated C-terminal domain-containing protein [Bacteroidales bacterium]|nr:gliding motility-associated C-terminal domain-containing protein [Bacteroidales bacterium]
MKTRACIIFLILLSSAMMLKSQYFPNPSFEGPAPIPNEPPPGWEKCSGSPDTQPGVWDVPTPPSNGISYLGICWLPSWIERVWTELENPLKQDSCYLIQVDLAYFHEINYYGIIQSTFPMRMNFHSSTSLCQEGPLLWQSPLISHTDWQTYEFVIDPEADIHNIVIRSYYDSPNMPADIGYILIDNIRVITPPDIDLGPDTTICFGDTINLNAGSGFGTYLWQDGSYDSTYNAYLPGIYYVIATTDYGCTVIDSIEITQSPIIELGQDTSFCKGDTLTLTPGPGFESYLWQDGSVDSLFLVWEPGFYEIWVQVTDSAGCSNSDTVSVEILNDTSWVFLGNDTILCDGSGLLLHPGTYYEYLWQDGSSDTAYFVTDPGTYWVQILDDCGFASDTIQVDFYPPVEVTLGNDTLLCQGDTIFLSPGDEFVSYLWQDSTTNQVYFAVLEGQYWVQVVDENGCTGVDTINIASESPPAVYLGNDTTLCYGTEFTLSPGEYQGYLWQDGSSDSTFVVTEPNVYWVLVAGNCGFATDTVEIEFYPPINLDLGADTAVCTGTTLQLEAGPGFTDYLWNTGATGQTLLVGNSGAYWVNVTDIYGCSASDTVLVEFFQGVDLELGEDTTICMGESIILDAGFGFLFYEWQDGQTGQYYTVYQSGNYSVYVEDFFGCSGSDEIFVFVSEPVVDLGPDTLICGNQSLMLDAGEGFVSYLWQDNSASHTYEVTESGIFWVKTTNEFGCLAYDEIEVGKYPFPVADLGPDNGFCAGDTLVLSSPLGPFDYYWNGEPGNNEILVTEPGTYTLIVANPCDSLTDEIYIEEYPVPVIDIGTDEVLLPGTSITLQAGDGFDTYIWQDGSGQSYFVVSENNYNIDNPYYFVEVSEGPCKNSDSVKIDYFYVWVPEVITPNGDGKNDIFKPDMERWNGINTHHMQVFNRWGERIWETENFPAGWDGKRNGKPVADGTYYWILDVYFGPENLQKTLKGSLTVLGTRKQ